MAANAIPKEEAAQRSKSAKRKFLIASQGDHCADPNTHDSNKMGRFVRQDTQGSGRL
jgi:hypothetical protein